MKKTLISLAAASLVASSAFAADKGIDINVGGQAVVWYQTNDTKGTDDSLFDQDNSLASVGVQLDLGADLGNNFTFGSQVSYIGTLGLENNLVSDVPQGYNKTGVAGNNLTDDLALTKIFIAKKIANTTLKMGRQELPKSLSPLAYTEGWNIFKNTFDAIVAINTDIPNTTIVGAYVGGSNGHTWNTLGNGNDSAVQSSLFEGAYMLTVQTTAIPMTTLTASYYDVISSEVVSDPSGAANVVEDVDISAIWTTANIAPVDMVKVDLQYGNVNPSNGKLAGTSTTISLDDTTAYGAKVTVNPIDALSVYAAYSSVDDGSVAVRNLGTGDKTPLFTSMVLTEDQASLDADAWTLAASYNMGDMGKVMLRYGQTDTADRDNNAAVNTGGIADADYEELNLIYSVKAGGVKYFAAYIDRELDASDNAEDYESQHIRVWARYSF